MPSALATSGDFHTFATRMEEVSDFCLTTSEKLLLGERKLIPLTLWENWKQQHLKQTLRDGSKQWGGCICHTFQRKDIVNRTANIGRPIRPSCKSIEYWVHCYDNHNRYQRCAILWQPTDSSTRQLSALTASVELLWNPAMEVASDFRSRYEQ